MACGCKKNKKTTKVLESQDYQPNGGGTVRMGLKESVRLPVRLPEALADGRDIIVLANKTQRVPELQADIDSRPAFVIYGRNAEIDTEHKNQLIAKWPQAFHAAGA